MSFLKQIDSDQVLCDVVYNVNFCKSTHIKVLIRTCFSLTNNYKEKFRFSPVLFKKLLLGKVVFNFRSLFF